MLELTRQKFDGLSLDGNQNLSARAEDKWFLRVQFDRGDASQGSQFFQRLGVQPPTSSHWRCLDGVVLLWDRPGVVVSVCDYAEQQRWLEFLEESRNSAYAPVVSAFDGLVLLSLKGVAVDDFLSSVCGYDFHLRRHAHFMATRLGDVRARLLLDETGNSGRQCSLLIDRSHLYYISGLIEEFSHAMLEYEPRA